MICRNCLRAASRARTPVPTTSRPQRYLATTSRLSNASATTPQPTATSTSTAQPSTLNPQPTDPAKKKPAPLVKSSIPAGTPLKGLNFEKNKADPVALPDEQYPPWLWTLLSRQEKKAQGAAGQGDLFSKSKKQRRLAAKRLRKEHALNPGGVAQVVPVYEQTVDLPGGDGTVEGALEAARVREGLTKAMRGRRRAGIKEGNFLKGMG